MIPIPQQHRSSDENLNLIRDKILERYHHDLIYRQNMNDSYLMIKMIEGNKIIPPYRMDKLNELKPFVFDVKAIVMPEINNIANINEEVSSIVGKLENISQGPTAANIKLITAQQRILNNLNKVFNRFKQEHQITDEKPAPTPRTSQSYFLMISPILLANIKLFYQRRNARDLTQAKTQKEMEEFVRKVAQGELIVAPEQGYQLMNEVQEQFKELKPNQLPLEWQIALEQELDKTIEPVQHLIHGNTEKISQLLDQEMYQAANQRLERNVGVSYEKTAKI